MSGEEGGVKRGKAFLGHFGRHRAEFATRHVEGAGHDGMVAEERVERRASERLFQPFEAVSGQVETWKQR